jgi:hypothetical protein
MTIELVRSKHSPSAWEGRFAFAIASGTGTKTFEAPDVETAKRLAWAVAEDWFSGT